MSELPSNPSIYFMLLIGWKFGLGSRVYKVHVFGSRGEGEKIRTFG